MSTPVGAGLDPSQARYFKVDRFNILNNASQVPVFYTRMYEAYQKYGVNGVSQEQTDILWNYLQNLPGATFERARFRKQHVGGVLDALLIPLKDAAAEAAHVLGQIVNHNSHKTTHNILFFILYYYNEMAMVRPKDPIAFMRKSGVDLAMSVDAIVSLGENIDVGRVKSEAKQEPRVLLHWLAGMVRSNFLVVHQVMGALLATTMNNLSFKIHSLCETFLHGIDKTLTPLDKLVEIATNLQAVQGIPSENKTRLAKAAEQARVFQDGSVGTVDPWIVASITTQLYHGEPIDRKVADLLFYQRMGRPMKEFMMELDLLLSALKTEVWLAIIALATSGVAEKTTIREYLGAYASVGGRWSLWGSGDDDDDDEEQERKDKEEAERRAKGKGKEEADTAEDVAYEKRQARRMAARATAERLKEMAAQKEARKSAIDDAMRSDPDNPYSKSLDSDEKIAEARVRVTKRLQDLINKVGERAANLAQVQQSVQNSNLETRILAGNAAIAAFTGSVAQHKTIVEALAAIDGLQTENIQVIAEQLEPLHFQMDVLNEILHQLDRRQSDLHRTVFVTSTKIGVTVMIVAGLFALLYYIYIVNNTWIGAVNQTLNVTKERATGTYTRGLVNMWEGMWREEYLAERANTVLGEYTPLVWLKKYDMDVDTLRRIAAEGMRQLTTYVTEIRTPVDMTRDALAAIVGRYNLFISPYVNGLTELLTETSVHLNELVLRGHTLETSADYQTVASLKDMIANALSSYKALMKDAAENALDFATLVRRIGATNHVINEAIQALQTKMMTGNLPEAVNAYARSSNNFFTNARGYATGVAGVIAATWKWGRSQIDAHAKVSPMNLTPYAMMNIVGAGRSKEWMEVFKDVGKATIAVGAATTTIPLLILFNLTNFAASLMHTGTDPTILVTRLFFNLVGGVTVLWLAVFQAIEPAVVGNYNLGWSFYGSVVAFLALCIPSLAIWMKLKEMIAKKIAARNTSEVQTLPAPDPTPSPNEPARSTPALTTTQATAVNPAVFAVPTPQITAPTIDVDAIAAASAQWIRQLEASAQPRDNSRGRIREVQDNEEEEDDTDVDYTKSQLFVQCDICHEQATVMCSHCLQKSYCGKDCGKYDWSSEMGAHLSFTKN